MILWTKFEAAKEAVLGTKSKKKVGGLAGVVAGKSDNTPPVGTGCRAILSWL